MHNSVWTDNIKLPEFRKLKGNVKTDVLIIGGGLCGILCAYFMKNAGVNYILVEGDRIASGNTKNTTAKITSQHGLIYNKLVDRFGYEKAKMYLDANQMALREYIDLCKNIDCDFEMKNNFVYSCNNRNLVEKEVSIINQLGFPAKFSEKTELPFNVVGAVCFPKQAQFNPLKFISYICKDLNIYERTFIREITPTAIITESGKIFAKKIIVATHFPFINKHGGYFVKLYQHRSYVSAYNNCTDISGMYVDESDDGLSFRMYDGLLLIGGGGHRTGKKGGCWKDIDAFANKYYPKSEIKFQWAAQDCMSLDAMPYIGQYGKKTPNLYVATGFNKWGMTSSMLSAMLLTDIICGRKNDYIELFSPQRSMLTPQLFINTYETATNFFIPTTKRCPHLGCALKWNKHEHTWDCPCHGSRFEKDGKLIDNPSTGNAKI